MVLDYRWHPSPVLFQSVDCRALFSVLNQVNRDNMVPLCWILFQVRIYFTQNLQGSDLQSDTNTILFLLETPFVFTPLWDMDVCCGWYSLWWRNTNAADILHILIFVLLCVTVEQLLSQSCSICLHAMKTFHAIKILKYAHSFSCFGFSSTAHN